MITHGWEGNLPNLLKPVPELRGFTGLLYAPKFYVDAVIRRIQWIAEITTAVQHLHDLDINHRSLHPRNIMLETDPTNPAVRTVKLIDFFRAFGSRGKTLPVCG